MPDSNRTIRDVAHRAGVSITTVSRTINSPSLVDPATARKVWKAIEDLNYLPDTQARSLVSGRSRLLGLVVTDMSNPFYADLIQSFEDIAVDEGYGLLLSSTKYDSERTSTCIRQMLERKVEGVIITSEMEDRFLDQIGRRSVPMVFIELAPTMKGVFKISVDCAAGIEQAISHLVGLGHRQIAFVSGPRRLRTANVRRAAFFESLHRHGICDDDMPVFEGDHKMTGGVAAAAELFKLDRRPTAVLTSNDLTALGVMAAVRQAGLRIPGDLSIVGFDDIWLAETSDPPLTTIRLCRRELASAAFRALLQCINGNEKACTEESQRVETRLVIRASTCAV
jgi:LacI family transcriptional regulator